MTVHHNGHPFFLYPKIADSFPQKSSKIAVSFRQFLYTCADKILQIKTADQGYIVKDDTEYAYDNQIPLWMFGFLY